MSFSMEGFESFLGDVASDQLVNLCCFFEFRECIFARQLSREDFLVRSLSFSELVLVLRVLLYRRPYVIINYYCNLTLF